MAAIQTLSRCSRAAGAALRGALFMRRAVLVWVAAITLPALGCNDGRPPMGKVTGRVTYNGEPVTIGGIIFTPTAGGRSSSAPLGPNGEYELAYLRDIKGAIVGEHTVSIATANIAAGRAEQLPAEYNTESTLTRTVEKGTQVINFELKGPPQSFAGAATDEI